MRHLCSIVVVLQMAILALCSTEDNSTTTEEPMPTFDCFHETAQSCPQTGCIVYPPNNDTALCCNMSAFEVKENLMVLQRTHNLTRLHIRNTTMDELNMNLFWAPALESIALTDSKVDRVVRQNLTNLSNLQCLNLSHNNLKEVDSRLMEDIPKLQQLDLSFNNLTNLSILPPVNNNNNNNNNNNSSNTDFFLDISNNTHLWCNNITDLRTDMRNASYNLHFRNQFNTTCVILRGGYWFQFFIKIHLQQLESIDQIENQCLKNSPCTCTAYRVVYTESLKPVLGFSVNCSGKNLTSLPEVPPHTMVLNVSNNNISSLKRIKTDPNYHDLKELHARNNQITTIQDIEGSHFLRQFQKLDIRENLLSEIQTYIFNHAFEQTRIIKIVQLAGNSVKCDCNAAQHVKFWLFKHSNYVIDYRDIKCESFTDKVVDLDPNKVCKYPRMWTDYINYIITVEVILLLLLVSKVSYDYWVFRTAGYLPWPASKMPKMPCDWVFET